MIVQLSDATSLFLRGFRSKRCREWKIRQKIQDFELEMSCNVATVKQETRSDNFIWQIPKIIVKLEVVVLKFLESALYAK
jgi:hypothetical protein